jgi:hypothetical protein
MADYLCAERHATLRQQDATSMHRHPHILNAATNLLGICFVIIGGLKIAHLNSRSLSDEAAWAAAFLLLVATIASYAAIRNDDAKPWQGRLSDGTFVAGVLTLMLSVFLAAVTL